MDYEKRADIDVPAIISNDIRLVLSDPSLDN